MEDDPVDVRARRRLRELRTEQGLTLREVAERASIDVSTLSRLESGKRRLALDHVPPLAAALGVSTDELLRSPAPADPRVRARPRRVDGMTMWPLSRDSTNHGLHAYKIAISRTRTAPPKTLPVHDGHEWLYVISGRLRLVLGRRDYTIDAGDAVEFSTWEPHWFGAVDGPVEVLAVFGPQGERLHLHG